MTMRAFVYMNFYMPLITAAYIESKYSTLTSQARDSLWKNRVLLIQGFIVLDKHTVTISVITGTHIIVVSVIMYNLVTHQTLEFMYAY